MISAVAGVARAFRIKGLASADFLVRDEEALLLEINPRPGATLDIFDCGATPLLRLHLDAVRRQAAAAPAEIRGCHGLGNRLCRHRRRGATRIRLARMVRGPP